VAGKTKRSGDWDKEGHIRVHLIIEQQQFSQPTKEMTNTRPRGLRIWYSINRQVDLAFVYHSDEFLNFFKDPGNFDFVSINTTGTVRISVVNQDPGFRRIFIL
jgi:hypothetical protein